MSDGEYRERWDMFVKGTQMGFTLYYNEQMTEDEVKADWLSSMERDWGEAMVEQFRGNVVAQCRFRGDREDDERYQEREELGGEDGLRRD